MKLWSFDVRSWKPTQAALLEKNKQAWKDHSYFVRRAQWDTNQAVPRKREASKLGGTNVVLDRSVQ
jgi:hypothetical protein